MKTDIKATTNDHIPFINPSSNLKLLKKNNNKTKKPCWKVPFSNCFFANKQCKIQRIFIYHYKWQRKADYYILNKEYYSRSEIKCKTYSACCTCLSRTLAWQWRKILQGQTDLVTGVAKYIYLQTYLELHKLVYFWQSSKYIYQLLTIVPFCLFW